MRYIIQAACGCNTGKIRKNNEDNFFFDGKILEQENDGLKQSVSMEQHLNSGLCLSVFDGMGGENFGEYASYAAARQMQLTEREYADFFIPEREYLERMTQLLDKAVAVKQEEFCTDRMGSTMVCLYFSGRYVHMCNVGDSRAYRLRDGEFLQMSQDHVEKRPGKELKKAPLTQYLGFGSEEVQLEPYIAKDELKTGDMYLLCSDGLTDMLTDFEISDIMLKSEDAESCVEDLIRSAMEHGGRDNITVIVCKLLGLEDQKTVNCSNEIPEAHSSNCCAAEAKRAEAGRADGLQDVPSDMKPDDSQQKKPLEEKATKRWFGALAVLALAVLLVFTLRPKHSHSWEAATCVQPKTCSECGETEGVPLAHELTDVGCEQAAFCINCGTVVEEARGHDWQEAEDGTISCAACWEIKSEEGAATEGEEAVEVDTYVAQAEDFAGRGEFRKAIQVLDEAWKETGDKTYYDLAADYRMAFGISNSSFIAAGKYNSILIKEDGSVMVVGDDEYDELDAKYWSDIVAVSAGDRHLVGLRANGTVVSSGSNDMGQRDVSGWSDVVAISAGDVHTIALKKDGTLEAAGQMYTDRCNVNKLHELAGDKRIVSIAAGNLHTLALLEDGTVIASGENGSLQCNVESWTDIAAIYAGSDFSLGLKTDGTVVMAGLQSWNVSGWSNIVNLAAGDFFMVGITDAGAIVHYGIEEHIGLKTQNTLSNWEDQDPVQIAAGNDHILVMNSAGLVRGVGKNDEDQIDIWDIAAKSYPGNFLG